MKPKILTNGPRVILGYRKNGTPIFPIAGSSEGPVEPPPGTTITIPTPVAQPVEPPAVETRTFTAADLEAARQQEKDKLYGRIDTMQGELKKITGEQNARLAAEEKARKDAEEAAEKARQENLSFEQKLAEMQAVNDSRFAEQAAQIAQRDAMLAREQEYRDLQEYKAARLVTESDGIMPELIPYVEGSSQEEIEAAIARAKETTAAIVSQVQQQQQQQVDQFQQYRQQARGTNVTAPPVGPMENNPGQQTYTAADIQNMPMAEYVKNRPALLAAASNAMRGQR